MTKEDFVFLTIGLVMLLGATLYLLVTGTMPIPVGWIGLVGALIALASFYFRPLLTIFEHKPWFPKLTVTMGIKVSAGGAILVLLGWMVKSVLPLDGPPIIYNLPMFSGVILTSLGAMIIAEVRVSERGV